MKNRIHEGYLGIAGMFLFAHLMASFLLGQNSVADLEDELRPGMYLGGHQRLEERLNELRVLMQHLNNF